MLDIKRRRAYSPSLMTVKTSVAKPLHVRMVDFLGAESWGMDRGRVAMEGIERVLRGRPEKIVDLDLSGVERMDASCSREAIANLVRRHRDERRFFLSGIGERSLLENIDVAFARQSMTVLVRHGQDYELAGHPLKDHALQTLGVVEEFGVATARRVCEVIKGLSLTACNNRLRDLCEAGLLLRAEGTAPSGGREFEYWAVR